MKNAAKCDTQCELQNSASHQNFERRLRWRDISSACLFQCACWHHITQCDWELLGFSLVKELEGVRSASLGQRSGHFYKWFRWKSPRNWSTEIKHSQSTNLLQSASEIKQDHPLNLSISVSGGKETNKDCLSSGERTGKSSKLKSVAFSYRIVI